VTNNGKGEKDWTKKRPRELRHERGKSGEMGKGPGRRQEKWPRCEAYGGEEVGGECRGGGYSGRQVKNNLQASYGKEGSGSRRRTNRG